MHAILCYVLFEDKRMIVLQMMCNMWILFYLMSLNCQGKGSTKAIIVFRNLTPSSSQPDSNNWPNFEKKCLPNVHHDHFTENDDSKFLFS